MENWAIKLQAAELECNRSRDEAVRLREQLDKLRAEKSRLELALDEAQLDADRAREAERRTALSLSETNRALKSAEEELALRIDAERRIEEMAQEMDNLRARNKSEFILSGRIDLRKFEYLSYSKWNIYAVTLRNKI